MTNLGERAKEVEHARVVASFLMMLTSCLILVYEETYLEKISRIRIKATDHVWDIAYKCLEFVIKSSRN